nr:PREDICTED: inaD-like protein [Latimeria chalumnae]|eukprot:XP_014352293.1 PREDICTED: inaD-like protein [Latimeria chalumnae]
MPENPASGTSTLDKQHVLQAIDRLKTKLREKGDTSQTEKLNILHDTVQSPLFNQILTIQHSIKQLKEQLNRMPSGCWADFDFSQKGLLVFNADSPVSALSGTPQYENIPSGTGHMIVNQPVPSVTPRKADNQFDTIIKKTAQGRQVEYIELQKPAVGGLGVSLIGCNNDNERQAGIFIKVQPGSIAARDGRLKENDHILAINHTPLDQNVSHQQAIALLQQSVGSVHLVVARGSTPNNKPDNITPSQPVRWNHIEDIELINDGSGLGFGIVGGKSTGVIVRTVVPGGLADRDGRLRTGDHILKIGGTDVQGMTSGQVAQVLKNCGNCVRMVIARNPTGNVSLKPPTPTNLPVATIPALLNQNATVAKPVNSDTYDVELKKKNGQSLGITVVGYVGSSNTDSSGVFVKSIVPGSAAEQNGLIQTQDRIVAVDGVNIQDFTNQEVVERLRNTGQTVHLTLARKKRCSNFLSRERSLDKDVSRLSLARTMETEINSGSESEEDQEQKENFQNETKQKLQALAKVEHLPQEDPLKSKWEKLLGPECEVMVVKLNPMILDDAELQKYSKLLPVHTLRLGVELDSFDGHHYISSVAPDGPAAINGLLQPEDELLEVNGVQLHGKSRREAVSFLREVPPPFTLVCCRRMFEDGNETLVDEPSSPKVTSRPKATSPELLSPETLKPPLPWEKVSVNNQVNSKSDADPEDEGEGELALWSDEVKVIELEKGSRGLGFSILDYQDPLDPARTVVVIRSLVAGGVAESNGGLLPGDRLVFISDNYLDNLTLAEAVEVIKSVPPGKVHLGICKPLVAEGNNAESLCPPDSRSEAENSEEMKPIDPLYSSILPAPWGFSDELAFQEVVVDEPEMDLGIELQHQSDVDHFREPWDLQQFLMPHLEEREMLVDDECLVDHMTFKPTEKGTRGIPEDTSSPKEKKLSYTEEWVKEVKPVEFPGTQLRHQPMNTAPVPQIKYNNEHEGEEKFSGSSQSSTSTESCDNRPKPESFKKTISLGKTNSDLGIRVKNDCQGAGLTVKHIDHEGAVGRDGKLKEGDFIVASSQVPAKVVNSAQGQALLSSELPEREEGEGEETPAFSHWGVPRKLLYAKDSVKIDM